MLVLLIVVLLIIIRIPAVQTFLVQQASSILSDKLGTKVQIDKVNIAFFDKLVLEGLMVEDRDKDTLLYAGKMRVNISDWFFVKDKIELKYISLTDAVVYTHRSDSVWNYQFIVDYFKSPNKKQTNKKSLEFSLKELHAENVRVVQEDNWTGKHMKAQFRSLSVLADKVDFQQKNIVINEIKIVKPIFEQSDFKGNRPENYSGKIKEVIQGAPYKWNNGGWRFLLKKLQVTDGAFKNDKETARDVYADRFDGQHIHFTEINGTLDSIVFSGDTLKTIAKLSTKERGGLNVRHLNAHIKFTPEQFEFNHLLLETDKSTLKNYYSMSYEAFNKGMSNFITDVILDAAFDSSVVHSDDLAIFAPPLKNWNRSININGVFKGTIDNFMARDVTITSGLTGFKGNIALRGLPNASSTYMDIEATQLATHYKDAIQIIPALASIKSPNLNKLGAIKFKGAFTGFLDDFVTHGSLQSNLGNLYTDLNMKFPKNGIPAYSGTLTAGNFRLGELLNIPKLDNITFKGNVTGKGFNAQTLNVNFDGLIDNIVYAGKAYRNITVTGDFDPNFFVGHLAIDDEKLKISTLDGTIRLMGEDMEINADARLEYADLKMLGISNAQMNLKGDFSVNFTGSNIDNFLGFARLSNATLNHEDKKLTFDSLLLTSTYENEQKILSLKSNQIDAQLNGQFNILDLPNSFKFFLSRYYPNYIGKPNYAVSNQNFSFRIETKSVDEYVRLFDKRLKGFDNSTIEGKLDIINSDFKLNASIPEFAYEDKEFNNVQISSTGNTDNVGFDITAGNITISDSLQFPQTNIKVSSSNDLSFISIQTSADKTLNEAVLNASVQTLPDGVRIRFFPSSFILNNKQWKLERDGELTIRKNFIDANEIKFVHNDQQIIIDTELSDETDQTHLTAKLVKVHLEDFAPLFMKKPQLAGAVTGNAYLYNLFGNSAITFEGVADSFSLNEKYVGKVDLKTTLDENSGLLDFSVHAQETAYNFNLDGSVNIKDSTNALSINLDAKTFNLDLLEPYLSTIFTDLNGIAQTKLKVEGPTDRLVLTGEAFLDSASFLIAYTQCRYWVKNQTIKFNKDEIDLGNMQLKDSLQNTGTLSGKISHEFFDKLYFHNLKFETGKMLLLNTTAQHNQQFYGRVIGQAKMNISGPLTNMIMDIRGQPSAIDTSHIFLPVGETSIESSVVDYIEFVQFGELMETPRFSEKTNILVLLDIDANPACKVDVILDEETGDEIKAQGNGNISIRVGNTEPLSIRGRYVLTKGEYNFNFQTFLQMPFMLTEGGSISWNGDPYQANIDIDAEYTAKNVDVSVLATAGGYRQKEDVTIIAHLTGILQKPNIDFDINLPDKSEIKNDYIAVKKLADFKNDQAEMNKQVASLLLFNTFIAGTQSFLTAENSLNIAASTIGGMMSNLLTRMLNKELEKATKGILSTYVDINPSVNLQTAANQLQANVRAGLKLLLSKRLFILVGGNLEYNNPATLQLAKRGLLTPDITIEWLLNKDGSLRVVGFNRTSIDLTIGQRNRSGVQFSYRKDFNRLSDIFKGKKQIEALEIERRNAKTALP